jgi:ribosome-associated translation inhibitor RaiA
MTNTHDQQTEEVTVNVIINSENLYLPESTKTRIMEALGKLEEVLPESARIRLFLKQDAKDLRAVLTVRDHHNNFAYSDHGDKMLALVRSARSHILQRLRNQKQKRIHRRKSRIRLPQNAA